MGLPASPSLCTKAEQGLSHWNQQGTGWQAGPDPVPLSDHRTDLIDDAEVRASTPSSGADFFCWAALIFIGFGVYLTAVATAGATHSLFPMQGAAGRAGYSFS